MSTLQITSRSHIVKKRYFRHEFQLIGAEEGAGYIFDCDNNGNIEFANDCQKKSYKHCINHPEMFEDRGLVVFENSYREPAKGKCSCGEKLELIDEYMGACQCPNCGQWYNLFGQSLVDPEYWEEGEDY